ncbi:MAG: HAD-IA family hydrolase [Bryobacteraceae bacterium]|nr:HAD-IA family hydrolase [Bryobacteraceae bacterium]MDW8377497.1 HAD-IA family hydrolase [Bryobacterales bacterium]
MIPRFPVYLFDVDGTLLDSAADICAAVREALKDTPAINKEDAYFRRFIGRHLFEMFAELFPDSSLEQREKWLADYRTIYAARGHRQTRPYPGVVEALSRLPGRKSTATTKGTPTTRSVLEKFGLLPYFDHVQGTDGFPAKPEPDVIHKSLEVFGVSPDQCLMVGDAPSDMAAGRAAGVKICAVRYGYGDHSEMAAFEPDYWIDDLNELVG